MYLCCLCASKFALEGQNSIMLTIDYDGSAEISKFKSAQHALYFFVHVYEFCTTYDAGSQKAKRRRLAENYARFS